MPGRPWVGDLEYVDIFGLFIVDLDREGAAALLPGEDAVNLGRGPSAAVGGANVALVQRQGHRLERVCNVVKRHTAEPSRCADLVVVHEDITAEGRCVEMKRLHAFAHVGPGACADEPGLARRAWIRDVDHIDATVITGRLAEGAEIGKVTQCGHVRDPPGPRIADSQLAHEIDVPLRRRQMSLASAVLVVALKRPLVFDRGVDGPVRRRPLRRGLDRPGRGSAPRRSTGAQGERQHHGEKRRTSADDGKSQEAARRREPPLRSRRQPTYPRIACPLDSVARPRLTRGDGGTRADP
jgi:hypothetical protein